MDDSFLNFRKFYKDFDYSFDPELDLKKSDQQATSLIPEKSLPNQFYYVINNLTRECVFVSDNITEITGYSPDEWTYERALNSIHPDDKPFVDRALYVCFNYCMSLDFSLPVKDAMILNYRIKHKKGHYIHILRHGYISSINSSNQMIHNTSMCMVISDFKFDTRQTMLMKKDNEVVVELHSDELNDLNLNVLSKREKEIVELLSLNKTSEQISKRLYISKHTVDTHRRKILKKLNIMNTTELLFKYIYKSA